MNVGVLMVLFSDSGSTPDISTLFNNGLIFGPGSPTGTHHRSPSDPTSPQILKGMLKYMPFFIVPESEQIIYFLFCSLYVKRIDLTGE